MQLLKSKGAGATASKPPSKPAANTTTATADNGPTTNTGKATNGLPAANHKANAPKDETATARATAAALARAKEVMRAGGTQAAAAAAAKEVARRVLREEQAKAASASGAAGNTGGAAGGNAGGAAGSNESGGAQSAAPATGGTEAHGGKPPLAPRGGFRAGLLGKFRKKRRSHKKSTKKRKPKRGSRPTIDPIDEESSLTDEHIGGKGLGSEEGRDDAEDANGRSASPVGKEGRAADDARDGPSGAAKKRELRSNLEKSSVFAAKSKATAIKEAPKSKANDSPAKAPVRATESILSDDYSYSTANSADTDSNYEYSYSDSRLNSSSRNYSRDYDRNSSMFTHRPSYGRNMPSIYIEADAHSTEDVSVLASKESAHRDPNIMDVLTFNGVMAAVDDAVDAALFPVDPHPSMTDGAGRRSASGARRNQNDMVGGALGGRSVGGDTRQSRGGFWRWLCVDVPGYGEACGEAYGDGDTKYSSNEETDGSLSLNDYYAAQREKPGQGQGVRNTAMAAAGAGAAMGAAGAMSGADAGLEPNKTVSWADSLDGPQPPSNTAPTNHARSHSNNSSVLHAVARGAAAGRDPASVPSSSLRNARWSGGSPGGEAGRERAGTNESGAMASQASKGTKDTKGSDGAASAPTEAASVGSRLSALFKWGGGSKAGEKASEAAGVEIATTQSQPPPGPSAPPSAAGNPGGIAANNDDKPNWRAYVADTVPTMPSATSPRSTVSHPSVVAAAGGGYRSPPARPQMGPQYVCTYQGPPAVGSAIAPGQGGSYVAPSMSGPATSGMAVAPGYTQSMSTLAMGPPQVPQSHPQPYSAPMTASPMTASQRWTPRVPKINSNLSVESEDDRTDRYAGMEQEVREAEEEAQACGTHSLMLQGQQAVGGYGYGEASSPALRMLMTEDTDGPPTERYGPPQMQTVVQQPPVQTQLVEQQPTQQQPVQQPTQPMPQPEPQPQQVQQHRSQASMTSNDCSTQLAEANRKLGLFQQSTETEPAPKGSHPPAYRHVDPNPSSVRFFAEQPPPATVSGLAVDIGAPPVQTPQDPPAMASPASPAHEGYAAAAASPTTPTHEGYTTFAA